MSCAAIHTGDQFLAGTLAYLDCQAAAIGSYGFGALADPASGFAPALGSLLALFVALFGMRLLFGPPPGARDGVADMLRVAIVLTLATSWPAWRTLGYDVVINGPGEVFRAIGLASQLPGSGGDLAARLQNVDGGLASFNVLGSGRLGVAQGDWFQLGVARGAFLVGTIVPLALVRLCAGILLAIAPLVAALLLFDVSRAVFAGWVRALVMVFLASLAISLVQSVELALIEPWLEDALGQRAAQGQTLDAPTEALAMTLAFAIAVMGVIGVTMRIAFHPSHALSPVAALSGSQRERTATFEQQAAIAGGGGGDDSPSRARRVAFAVSDSMRRDERITALAAQGIRADGGSGPREAAAAQAQGRAPQEHLGSSHRRTARRHSRASFNRDSKT